MSNSLCFELYPYGTLGRLFIDLTLEYIDRTLYQALDNKICIKDPTLLAEELEGLLKIFFKEREKCFYLTNNDNSSLAKDLGTFFSWNEPITIVKFVIESLNYGGYENLSRILTAPILARIEFFEYAKPGYVTKITNVHRNHPYKKINTLSLALAILGGYISYIKSYTIKKGKELSMVYLIPLQKIEIALLSELKQKINKYYQLPPSTLAYLIAKYITKLQMHRRALLGYLIAISVSTKSRSRPRLTRIEPLSSEGLEEIILALSTDSKKILDAIVEILKEYYDELYKGKRTNKSKLRLMSKFTSSLVTIILDIYRASRGSIDSLYDCVRTIVLVRDNIMYALERGAKDSPWIRLYSMLKNRVDEPVKALNILARDLSNIVRKELWRGIYEF